MARLIIESSREKREVAVQKEIVIGRSPDVALPFEDGKLSREHTRITFDGHDYQVEDLESKNGTYVDGRRIRQRTLLHSGAEIRAGNVVLRFVLDASDPQPVVSDSVDDRVSFEKQPTARKALPDGERGSGGRFLAWVALAAVLAGGAYGMKIVFVWALKVVAS